MTEPMLRRPEVERQTGLSKTSIYRLIREGSFPRPRQISRQSVAWSGAEIEEWKQSRSPARAGPKGHSTGH